MVHGEETKGKERTMHDIELDSAEQELLAEILENALTTLENEIRHTDHGEFRELLRSRRQTLESLIAKTTRHEPLSA